MDTNYYNDEVEIDLIELAKHCWKHKWKIIIPTAIAAVLVVVFSVVSLILPPEKSYLPNKYTSTTTILVNEKSGGLSLSSSLSSLASMAGVNTSKSSPDMDLLLTIASTNTFKDRIIEEFNLIERWKIESRIKASSRKALNKVLKVATEKDSTNVLYVSFTDIDPEFARTVSSFAANLLMKTFHELKYDQNSITLRNYADGIKDSYARIVQYQNEIHELERSVGTLNAASAPSIMLEVNMKKVELEAEEAIYAQFKASYELLATNNENEPTELTLLEEAEVPDEKSSPSRGKICIITVFAAGFAATIVQVVKYVHSETVKRREEAEKDLEVKK